MRRVSMPARRKNQAWRLANTPTPEEKKLNAISNLFRRKLISAHIGPPLRELEDLYESLGGKGPKPVQIARKWLSWKSETLQRGKVIREIRVLEPGRVLLAFDPEAPPKSVANEVRVYLESIRTFTNWATSSFKDLPQNRGARGEHPINGMDFFQDLFIVISRNAGWSYRRIAKVLRSDRRLGWRRQEQTAINRVKKRMPILRGALGQKLVH